MIHKAFWMCLLSIVVPTAIVNAQDRGSGANPTPHPLSANQAVTAPIADGVDNPFVAGDPQADVIPDIQPMPAYEGLPGPYHAGPRGYQGTRDGSLWLRFKSFMQWSHWGYADRFQEVPLGASVIAANQAQIENATAARFILYHYDFCEDPASGEPRLNDRGLRRLHELATQRPLAPGVVLVVQRTPNQPKLDEARRNLVDVILQHHGMPVQVVIGEPMVPGMAGDQAAEVYTQMMKNVGKSVGTSVGLSTGRR